MQFRARFSSTILACALLAAPGATAQEAHESETTATGWTAAAELGKGILAASVILARLGLKAGYAGGAAALAGAAWAFSGADGYVFGAIAAPAWGGDWFITREQAFLQADSDFFGSRPAKRAQAARPAEALDSIEATEDAERVERYWTRRQGV